MDIEFEDGYVLTDVDDIDDYAEELTEEHGEVKHVLLDEQYLPNWLPEKVGLEGLHDLAYFYDKCAHPDVDALCIWMENCRYSDPEPWRGFDRLYIGKFDSDEDFGRYVVGESLDCGYEIPDFIEDLIDYSRVFDRAKYWKQDGHYFCHY